MRALLFLALVGLAGCANCGTNPTPIPPNPPVDFSDAAAPPSTLPPALIYGELVEAGCLDPDDSGEGLAGVVELEFGDAEPPWLACLAAGGTAAACQPCP